MTTVDKQQVLVDSPLHPDFDRSVLSGYDTFMHQSPVVNESVEQKHGTWVIVYRTKPEISEEAERRRLNNPFMPR